jgi:tetratricopeptide (TPR) repeat protein
MLGLTHAQFNSGTQRNERFFAYEFAGQQQADYDRRDGVVAYSWVVRYTREFLDARLKGDAAAAKFLRETPAEHGVPPHTLAIRTRNARPQPASFETFRQQVQKRGFGNASSVRDELIKAHPDLRIESDAIGEWGYDLLARGRAADALPLMLLAARLNDSPFSHLRVGEAYEGLGDRQRAAAAYNEALKRDANNIFAKARLAALSVPQP